MVCASALSFLDWKICAVQEPSIVIVINSPREKPEQWPPGFLHKLKHTNGAKDWLIPNKAFKGSQGARSIMTLQSNEVNHIQVNAGIRHQSSCSSPVNKDLIRKLVRKDGRFRAQSD